MADAVATGGGELGSGASCKRRLPARVSRSVPPLSAPLLHLSPSSQGEFFSLAQRSAVPFPPLALALPPDHNHMVYFGASSYFFNTAAFAYHAAGVLVFEITDATVSSAAGPGLSLRLPLAEELRGQLVVVGAVLGQGCGARQRVGREG